MMFFKFQVFRVNKFRYPKGGGIVREHYSAYVQDRRHTMNTLHKNSSTLINTFEEP